jgi:hypothetical protein
VCDCAVKEIVVTDFEGQYYGQWLVLGDAWGDSPVTETLFCQVMICGFAGKRYASSYHGVNAATGQTPVFGGMFSLWTSHCS